MSALPDGKRAATDHEANPGRWHPTHEELGRLPTLFQVLEESSVGLRSVLACVGGLNLRPMRLHFQSNPERAVPDAYTVERPCRLGGGCCCPLEMTLFARHRGDGADVVGKVHEYWPHSPLGYCERCFATCCTCTTDHRVLSLDKSRQALLHKYSLRTSTCCCGRVNNCCGATCCRHDLIADILDADGTIVGVVQKTYAPSGGAGVGACCRCLFDVSNYIMKFPEAASEDERALLVTAVLNTEFQLFERKGGE